MNRSGLIDDESEEFLDEFDEINHENDSIDELDESGENNQNEEIEESFDQEYADDDDDDDQQTKSRLYTTEYISSFATQPSSSTYQLPSLNQRNEHLNRLNEAIDRRNGYIDQPDEDFDPDEEIDDSTSSQRNPGLGNNDDSEYMEAQEYLKASIVSYIQSKCPVEIGYPNSLYIIRTQDEEIDPRIIGVKYFFCMTIPKTALVEGASTFRDFDRNTDIGRAAFREFEFFRKAFCDPSIGVDIHHDSAYYCPRESSICSTYGDTGIAPKVVPIVEPLFKKPHRTTYTVSTSEDVVVQNDVSIIETLVPDNIVGFRVWFFLIDFSIDPVDAVIKRVLKNREEMGLSPLFLQVTESDAFVSDAGVKWFKGDPMKTFGFICKLNNNAKRENASIIKQRQIFEDRRRTQDSALFASYEIKSVSEVFNFFRCHESRCLECTPHVRCRNCSVLRSAYWRIANDMTVGPDTQLGAPHAKFDPIPRGSMLTSMIDASLLSKDMDVRVFAGAFIDPILYLNHQNPTTIKILNHLEVCSEQTNPDNYIKLESPVNQKVTFAFPNLVFTFNAVDFGSDELLNIKLPWAYDLFDITMDCIEEVVAAKRSNQDSVENKDFFDSLTSANAVAELDKASEITESIKRMIPKPIHPHAQGKEYKDVHQQFSKPLLPMPKEVLNKHEKIIRGDNDIRDCALAMREKINKLQKSINYIGGGTLRKLLEILQKQGMRDLKRLFIPDSKTPYIVRAASTILLDLIRNGKTAYSEMNRVAHNLESYTADFLLQLYFYFEGVGVIHNHHILLDIIISAWRASHCPITDQTYQHTSLLLNMILQGTAAVGKSFLTEVASANLISGTIPRKSSASARAINRVQPEDGRVEQIDEMGPGMDPGKIGTPDDKDNIGKVKERTTSHVLAHETVQMSAAGNSENVAERSTVTIVSEIHNAILGIVNDFSAIPGEDDSFVSRFMLYIINAGVSRKGTMDLTSKATPFGASSITKLLTSPVVERQKTMITMHALHVAYAKGIALGAFVYPCLDMLSFHFVPTYKRMLELIPSIGRTSRGAERLTSKALAMAIANGIYFIFNSVGSPLIDFKRERKQIRYLPFTLDQLTLVQPYTFLAEDTAIGLIVEHFHSMFVPALYWQVAMEIASMFANYGPKRVWNFRKTRIGQVNSVDPNYLHCDRKVGTIISALCKRGINQYSARLIIRYLLIMEINVKTILPRPEDQLRKQTNQSTVAPGINPDDFFEEEVNAANVYTTKPLKSPVFILETPTDRRYAHPNHMLEDSELFINIHYLKHFSPMQITQEIMNVICYKGIRPRRILLNVADEELPFLPKTWDIVPGNHSQTAASAETMHKHIKKALCSNKALTLPVRELADQMKSRNQNSVSFYDADAETALCVRWLTENPVYDPARTPEDYTPKKINMDIAERTRNILFKEKQVQYPEDILAYYENIGVDESLTGVEYIPPASLSSLTDDQSAEIEEAIESQSITPEATRSAYQERLASIMSRHASSSTPSTSSSSSSSSSSQRLPYHRTVRSGDEPSAKKPRNNSTSSGDGNQLIEPSLAMFSDDF